MNMMKRKKERSINRGRLCLFHDMDGSLRWGYRMLKSRKWLSARPDGAGMVDRHEYFEAEETCPVCRMYNEESGYPFWSRKEVRQFERRRRQAAGRERVAVKKQRKTETREPVLEVIERHLKSHYWDYENGSGDDDRARGGEHWAYLCRLFRRARNEGVGDGAHTLFAAYAPAHHLRHPPVSG
jgi:hypothetical protein